MLFEDKKDVIIITSNLILVMVLLHFRHFIPFLWPYFNDSMENSNVRRTSSPVCTCGQYGASNG
jgi:hypothetical protein